MLFDIGGVLVENVGFARLNSLLPTPLDEIELRERLLHATPWREFELGCISAETFATRFVQDWQLPLSAQAFIDEFTMWPRAFYPGAKALLQRVRQRYRVAALTNCNAIHWARFGGFAEQFDVCYSSHLLGLIKPDREIFEYVIRDLAVAPEEIVFFDDSLSNVEQAHRLGMQAHHVLGFEALKEKLSPFLVS